MPWTRARETAAALDAAIAALDADAPDVVSASRLADALTQETRDLAAPEVSDLAHAIARALAFIAAGQVEPHHGKWQMAASIVAARQALDHIAVGESYAPVALAGARYELETLFPPPEKLIPLSVRRTPRT